MNKTIIIFTCFLAFINEVSAFNQCQRSGGKITDVINITLDFAGSKNMELVNIVYDKRKFKTINKVLYGENAKSHEITDIDIHGKNQINDKQLEHWKNDK